MNPDASRLATSCSASRRPQQRPWNNLSDLAKQLQADGRAPTPWSRQRVACDNTQHRTNSMRSLAGTDPGGVPAKLDSSNTVRDNSQTAADNWPPVCRNSSTKPGQWRRPGRRVRILLAMIRRIFSHDGGFFIPPQILTKTTSRKAAGHLHLPRWPLGAILGANQAESVQRGSMDQVNADHRYRASRPNRIPRWADAKINRWPVFPSDSDIARLLQQRLRVIVIATISSCSDLSCCCGRLLRRLY